MFKFFYFILCICLTNYHILESRENVTEAMKHHLILLEQEKSFVFVDLGLTSHELALLDNLKIKEDRRYDQFGDLYLMEKNLPAFLKEIGNDNDELTKTASEIISRTVQNVVNATCKNSAWVSIRSSLPDSRYDIPRWHMDGSDYGLNTIALYPELTWKFATSLKGSPTLMYDLPLELRDTFIAHFNDRNFLSQLLDINQAKKTKPGQGVFFIVGDKRKGAIHSEPSLNESRLFLSIVPGNSSEIDEFYLRRMAQDSDSKTWDESSYFDERSEEQKKKDEERSAALQKQYQEMMQQKPSIGDVITSPQIAYTITSPLPHIIIDRFSVLQGIKLFAAKDSNGKMYTLSWYHGFFWFPEFELNKNLLIKENLYLLGSFFDHPNIIKSVETFLDQKNRSFDVFEYVPGTNLSQIADKSLTENEAITIVKQLISIISYIHSLHYDFIPQLDALIINENKELILCDLKCLIELDASVSLQRIVDYINICIHILSKADTSFEVRNSYKVELMKLIWQLQEDFDYGNQVSLQEILDKVDGLLFKG